MERDVNEMLGVFEMSLSDKIVEKKDLTFTDSEVILTINVKQFIKEEGAPIDMPDGNYTQDFIDGIFWAWDFLRKRRKELAGKELI